jgi:hypothetical protein
MKLEVGKYYLRNDGVKVGPANFRNDLAHRYGGYWVLDGWHYDENGRHLYGYDSKHLVGEIPPVLKLEEGKYYLTRGGVKVGPMKKIWSDKDYSWGFTKGSGSYHNCYTEVGQRYRTWGITANEDLISEWKEVTSMDIQVGDIVEHVDYKDTLFEVLAVHDKDVWVKIKGGAYPKTVYLCNLRKPAPKPVVEEVVMYTNSPTRSYFGYTADNSPVGRTHKITFNTVDGVADCKSIKMEKL